MRRSVLALVLLASSSARAAAQTIIFQDGFENGFAQWTATGLWNAVSASQSCMAAPSPFPVTPFPEGTNAAWYGIPSSCNYNTFSANSGGIELNTWVTLPLSVASVTLYFQSRVTTEYCAGNFDVHRVTIIAQGGPDTGFSAALCQNQTAPILPWHERRVDLSAYRGAQVRVRFDFSTNDANFNGTLGWIVDDVRIVAEPGSPFCPPDLGLTRCPCSFGFTWGGGCPQSNGSSATLMSGGQASFASDSLTFTAAHMPPGTTALLFQGSSGSSTGGGSFGDGLLCIGGAFVRMGATQAPTGSQSWPLAGSPPLSVDGFIPATGGDAYYQVWFRDAALYCAPATYNLTSAQRVTWTP